MIIITTQEKAIKKINDINPNYTVLSEFNGWREDITRKCNICGDIRTVKARSLVEKNKNGELRKCPVCVAIERAKSKRKTHEEFVEELYSIKPYIEILSKYVTNSEKVKCRCKIDGFEWETTPHSLLDKKRHGCPECANKKQNRRTHEQFIKEMKEKHPTITPLSDFTKVNDSMLFRCEECGYEWKTAPNLFLNKDDYGCPKCVGHGYVSEQEMIERLEKCNPKIVYLSGYKGITFHANFKCLRCGNEWHTLPNSVLNGRGCPTCHLSHGALEVKRVLDSLNIIYESEYRFDDCKDNRTLPFDFYIKSKNICIEYDGEQHFMPIRHSKSESEEQILERFETQKRRDNIKTLYCKNNNITLIRIPYTEFNNIENILNKHVS